jgi:IS4 transposase
VTQDGRALRRYRRRWKIERTFAWLGNFRHLVVRYDRSLTIYSVFNSYRLFHDRLTEGFEIASSKLGGDSPSLTVLVNWDPTPSPKA